VSVLGLDTSALLSGVPDVVLVDATTQLVQARATTRTVATMKLDLPLLAVFTEGGVTVLDDQWPVDDFLLTTTGPAETEARRRRPPPQGRAGRYRGRAATGDEPGVGAGRRGAGPWPDRRRRRRRRRGQLDGAGRREAAGPHLQGVRAAQVPRAAPRPGGHPGAAAAGGLGHGLLRGHPDRRRPRAAAARQARPGAGVPDQHHPERRIPVRRSPGPGAQGRGGIGRWSS